MPDSEELGLGPRGPASQCLVLGAGDIVTMGVPLGLLGHGETLFSQRSLGVTSFEG